MQEKPILSAFLALVKNLGKIDGDGFSLDGAEALSLSSAVDCRIGSLENRKIVMKSPADVDCRIGSLEKLRGVSYGLADVDCRIGSLESSGRGRPERAGVDCRIGSLERERGNNTRFGGG